MTHDMDDEPWVEILGPRTSEVLMPPDQYPVPATTHPPMPLGHLVTIGVPGRYWLIDALIVHSGPRMVEGREQYTVNPTTMYAANQRANIKAGQGGGLVMVTRWTDELWVYRDAPQDREVDALEPLSSHGWFERVQQDVEAPPPVRRPRPAREMVSLTGRRVRFVRGKVWVWRVAVTEPYMLDDVIVVGLADLGDYELTLYGLEPSTEWVEPWPLHALWVY